MMPITEDAWTVADPTLCDRHGRESCEAPECLPEADEADAGTSSRLRAVPASDVLTIPRPVEIIEGAAVAGCLTVLVSESGSGKTFVLLDQAAHVSAGLRWHGRHTLQGSVVYLGFEGDAIGLRLQALRHAGHQLDHVYIIRAHDPISPRVTRDGEIRSPGELAVIEALDTLAADLATRARPPIRLVQIDTARASMAGSEDSSEHVSAYLRAQRRIMARVPDAAFVLAHHAGWQDGDTQRKRERGSSAWRGNCDATLYLEAGAYDADTGEAELTLRTLKIRDAERPAPLHLIRRRVELPIVGLRGEPVTSCVIEGDRRSREDREAEQQAATAAAERETDLAVLRAMRDHAPTNARALRAYAGANYGAVQDAVTRILRAGWAVEGKRGQPYQLTGQGIEALS